MVTTTKKKKEDPAIPAWLNAASLYTINIYLDRPTQDHMKALQYVNVPVEKVIELRNECFKVGIRYTMKPTGTIELISPFNIASILVMPQKEKQ
jgi:hypothetical protein